MIMEPIWVLGLAAGSLLGLTIRLVGLEGKVSRLDRQVKDLVRRLNLAPEDSEVLTACRERLKSEGKIEAIKQYRHLTGAGLREAKEAIDALHSERDGA